MTDVTMPFSPLLASQVLVSRSRRTSRSGKLEPRPWRRVEAPRALARIARAALATEDSIFKEKFKNWKFLFLSQGKG